MEQKLATLSLKYPWFLFRRLDGEEGDTKTKNYQRRCTMYEWMSLSRSRLRGLTERNCRGCFHGWVIISHNRNVTWSLWNPATSKTILLPPLDGDFESIDECLLSSPPNHPTSVLMLTRTKSPTIVLCQLGRNLKRKRLRWKELTYAKQLMSITGDDGHGFGFLHCLTSYNGKVFALSNRTRAAVVQVDIVVKDKEDVVISLSLFGKLRNLLLNSCPTTQLFLKGHCEDLFYIKLDFNDVKRNTLGAVFLFKLDRTGMIWEQMDDLKDAVFFIDLSYCCSVFYRDALASELGGGGFAHIFGGETGKVIYSYDVKEKTISLSPMSFYEQWPQWECELQLHGDDGEIECETPEPEDEIDFNNTRSRSRSRNEEENSDLLNIPFDVLKMIMELCVGVEYLNLRATCKSCQLAAPLNLIRWRSNETWSLRRRLQMQTYSCVSPWLIVLNKQCRQEGSIITFIDPMFGDKYFMTTPQELIGDLQICCSRYGWLLLMNCSHGRRGGLFFFNPFTNDIRKLPDAAPDSDIDSLCFSDPPTCADCVVVGLSRLAPSNVFIHIPSSSNHDSWILFRMDFGGTAPHSFCFPTIRGGDTYALSNKGAALHVFLENPEGGNVFTNAVVAEAPPAAQYFLVNCVCDEHGLVLVAVDEVGEAVQVFKLNVSAQEWEKIDSLGRHMIYICGTTCLCVEAKTPEMENNIYFPLLHSKTGKIVFYSLETCRYHTSNARNIQQGSQDFFGTKYHVNSHAWIQPSWS